ncbi:MAG: RNA 2'-phosphotransferase [Lachnospiraceae bacterium]|nr:RNA 2'-phosphotransferase [Lachnospiraceae bacterium]
MGKRDKLSVFISLVLRHNPGAAQITLDEHGWADVKELLAGVNNTGRSIDRETLEEIVRTDQKQRYSFSEDHSLIRANQGHSISVDVELKEQEPPEVLYHGTAQRFLDLIRLEGLKPMSRLYVHLSKEIETAAQVGRRHGQAVILQVKSGQMSRDGGKFYLSENGVWLTKRVDVKYLKKLDGSGCEEREV